MNVTPTTPQPADTLPEQPARRLRVLVAEDHPLNQRLFALILSERGHDHVVVSNGKEALQILEQQSFDVILMDVQMPEMDGYQTTAEIRRRELVTGTRTRIIAMTALELQQDRDLSLVAGMDDYIPKPIDRMDLLRRIETAPLAADGARAAHSTPIADVPPEPLRNGDDPPGGEISPAK